MIYLIAKVILPIPIKAEYDYLVTEDNKDKIGIGKRVLVVFGKKKIYTGIVKALTPTDKYYEVESLKHIDEVVDDERVVTDAQLKLFDWIADYYFCSVGDVMKAAIPTGMKLESTQKIFRVEGFDYSDLELDDKEFLLMEALDLQSPIPLNEVAEIWGIQNPWTRLRKMENRAWIRIQYEVEDKYKPKTENYLSIPDELNDKIQLNEVLDNLRKAPRQESVMMVVLSNSMKGNPTPRKKVNEMLPGSTSAISTLIKKGLLVQEEVEVDRIIYSGQKNQAQKFTLSEEQNQALSDIRTSFTETPSKPVLLHGITGSGKTQVYIDLIKDEIEKGNQVLYLLPEIGLTKQIIDRVMGEFGEDVGIYHSRFNINERVEIWKKVLDGTYRIVIGVRSAIFLPFSQLKLLIVDEEHDSSFKQTDPAPRYHARDLAILLAKSFKGNVLLGSATPSFESYQNAMTGKYSLATMKKRVVAATLPEIRFVDMKVQRKKKLNKGYFSTVLIEEIQEMLRRGEQGILFQNRRGFSPFLICNDCSHVPKCINCDISLTFHKKQKELRCHTCGYKDEVIAKCHNCHSFNVRQEGAGTERLEEEILEIFPDIRVTRMDYDTTRGKHAFSSLIRDFENHQIDLLVGTQMVSKGLDFEGVTLVGIVDPDMLLNFPDFRAYERAFQLITQVAGRAGRSTKKGQVIIQTSLMDNPVLKQLQDDFGSFFRNEIGTRKQLHFPPFSRLIQIELRHRDFEFVYHQTNQFYRIIKQVKEFDGKILGPAFPPVNRIKNQYRMQILLKIMPNLSTRWVRAVLKRGMEVYYENAPNKTVRIVINIDP